MWSRFILFFFASINKDIGIPWIFSMSAWKGIITRNRIYLRQSTIDSSELRNGLIQISRCVFVTNIFQRPYTYIASVGGFYLRKTRIHFLIIALHSRRITKFDTWFLIIQPNICHLNNWLWKVRSSEDASRRWKYAKEKQINKRLYGCFVLKRPIKLAQDRR